MVKILFVVHFALINYNTYTNTFLNSRSFYENDEHI